MIELSWCSINHILFPLTLQVSETIISSGGLKNQFARREKRGRKGTTPSCYIKSMCVNQSVTLCCTMKSEANGQMYKNGDKSSLKSVPSLYALLEIGSSQSKKSVQTGSSLHCWKITQKVSFFMQYFESENRFNSGHFWLFFSKLCINEPISSFFQRLWTLGDGFLFRS